MEGNVPISGAQLSPEAVVMIARHSAAFPPAPTGRSSSSGATHSRTHRDDERILFWHRGLSITDLALGQTMLAKAQGRGIGTTLQYRS